MKKFTTIGRQGDVLILPPIKKLPKGAIRVEPVGGKVIVAHSETGHHHVMDARTTEMYRLPDSIYDCFIVVKEPTALDHERSWSTHESLLIEPGIRPIRRQREGHTPEGMRRVED